MSRRQAHSSSHTSSKSPSRKAPADLVTYRFESDMVYVNPGSDYDVSTAHKLFVRNLCPSNSFAFLITGSHFLRTWELPVSGSCTQRSLSILRQSTRGRCATQRSDIKKRLVESPHVLIHLRNYRHLCAPAPITTTGEVRYGRAQPKLRWLFRRESVSPRSNVWYPSGLRWS